MRGRASLAATGLLASTLANAALAAPIRTTSPSTGIFLGNIVAQRASFVEAERKGVDLSIRSFPLAAFYSPTTNTLVGIVVPYVEKRLEIDGLGQGSTRGLGDITLIGHYRFWNRLGRGSADLAALRLGLKLPTGSTTRDVGLPVSEPERRALQPGSGSTDFTFTFAAAREHYRYNIDFDLGYRLNTTHDGMRFGNRAFSDLSLQVFLLPAWTRRRGFELLAALEAGYLHEERGHFQGAALPASGGNSLFLSPGLQLLASERILVEASLRLPLRQSLHGPQPELSYDALLGLRLAF